MTLNKDWFFIYFGQVNISFAPGSSSRTITSLPRGIGRRDQAGEELQWTYVDDMSIKQVVITPFEPLGGFNEESMTITFSFLVENEFGQLISRAALTYTNSVADTSPPPSNPVNPGGSTGEVWDLGLVVPKNRIMEIVQTSSGTPANPGSNQFQVGLVGTWLRDIPEE